MQHVELSEQFFAAWTGVLFLMQQEAAARSTWIEFSWIICVQKRPIAAQYRLKYAAQVALKKRDIFF